MRAFMPGKDRFAKKRGLTISVLIFSGVLAVLSPAAAWAKFYRYTDEEGVLHVTDDITKIPEKYRDEAVNPKAKQSVGTGHQAVTTRQDNDVKGLGEDRFINEVMAEYVKGNFHTVAKMFDDRIAALEVQAKMVDDRSYKGISAIKNLNNYRMALAYIYAWKLGKPDAALFEFRKIDEFRHTSLAANKRNAPIPMDYVFAGEIYEMKGEFGKAIESYRKALNAFEVLPIQHDSDEMSDMAVFMGPEITGLIKYQIDWVNLKSGKVIKPELPKLKITHFSKDREAILLAGLALMYNPVILYETASLKRSNPGFDPPFLSGPESGALANAIKNSPANLSFMVTDYMFIMMSSAGSVTKDSEKALEAYLSKYPESYYSLYLRRIFYRYYRNNGQDAKAQRLLSELKKIEIKRKIDLGLEPDKRFSSPAETFKTFKDAFLAGDADTAQECFIPDGRTDFRAIKELNAEQRKEAVGGLLIEAEKGRITGDKAVYPLKKIDDKKLKSEEVDFVNIDGEWKMIPR